MSGISNIKLFLIDYFCMMFVIALHVCMLMIHKTWTRVYLYNIKFEVLRIVFKRHFIVYIFIQTVLLGIRRNKNAF